MMDIFTKPYIVGETSFPGTNDTANPYMSYPYAVYGTEKDGLDFVEQTFPWIRNSNASGYQWWQFQDVHWAEVKPTGPIAHLEDTKECYHGLLRFGDPEPGNRLRCLPETCRLETAGVRSRSVRGK